MFLFRLFALLAALVYAHPAHAQNCELGVIKYNMDHDVYQGCTKRGWKSFHEMGDFCPGAGLVGHWKLNESGNVSTAADSSVTGNDGTLTNFPADPSANWVAGKLGNALDFDGQDDYLTVAHTADWNFAGKNVSVALWFRSPGSANDGEFFEHHSAPQGWIMRLEENDAGATAGKIRLIHGGTDTIDFWTNARVDDDAWHHVVFTLDGSTARSYINGAFDNSDAYSGLTDIVGTHTVYVGSFGGTSKFFDGQLDDVRIYNVALDATEVSALYNGGAGCQ